MTRERSSLLLFEPFTQLLTYSITKSSQKDIFYIHMCIYLQTYIGKKKEKGMASLLYSFGSPYGTSTDQLDPLGQ